MGTVMTRYELAKLPEMIPVKWIGRKLEVIVNEDSIIIRPWCYKEAIEKMQGKYTDTLRQLNDEELVMEYGEERISLAFYKK